ncbi:MAG: hypothetical protein L0K86_20540 [Actinomycetia bacterium]|nr:hypothetical protein [Actinomycetes bacterium]
MTTLPGARPLSTVARAGDAPVEAVRNQLACRGDDVPGGVVDGRFPHDRRRGRRDRRTDVRLRQPNLSRACRRRLRDQPLARRFAPLLGQAESSGIVEHAASPGVGILVDYQQRAMTYVESMCKWTTAKNSNGDTNGVLVNVTTYDTVASAIAAAAAFHQVSHWIDMPTQEGDGSWMAQFKQSRSIVFRRGNSLVNVSHRSWGISTAEDDVNLLGVARTIVPRIAA